MIISDVQNSWATIPFFCFKTISGMLVQFFLEDLIDFTRKIIGMWWFLLSRLLIMLLIATETVIYCFLC